MTTNVTVSTIAKLVQPRHPAAIQVEAKWRSSPYPGLRKLTCEYCDGILTIRGHVTSYYLKQMAQVTARELFPSAKLSNCTEVVLGKSATGEPFFHSAAPQRLLKYVAR